MKLLLLGKNGQVGWELQRALAPLGTVTALDRHGDGELSGDLSAPELLAATVRRVAPDVIVNAGAYTAVDRAESEPELAQRVNADAPDVLAREAAALGAWLVHYSTDYVFDGSGERPWIETDAPAPLSIYGRTKLAGEEAILASGARALIFRTSWVYATRGNNFARTMLRLAQERDELRVVADQFGAPTGADLIADVTAHAIRHVRDQAEAGGIYHLAAAGTTNWCDYARFVLAEAERAGRTLRVSPDRVEAIAAASYPTPAPRPHNSRLATDKLRKVFGLELPDWRTGVARAIAEWME